MATNEYPIHIINSDTTDNTRWYVIAKDGDYRPYTYPRSDEKYEKMKTQLEMAIKELERVSTMYKDLEIESRELKIENEELKKEVNKIYSRFEILDL